MKKQILIAEDEENIAQFLEKGFTEFGFEVTVCNNGNQSWQTIVRKNDTDKEKPCFDIILLDIMMPEINGIEVCKLIRSHFAYRSYIIMLTALGSTEDIVAGLDSGADDYVVKPFKFT